MLRNRQAPKIRPRPSEPITRAAVMEEIKRLKEKAKKSR